LAIRNSDRDGLRARGEQRLMNPDALRRCIGQDPGGKIDAHKFPIRDFEGREIDRGPVLRLKPDIDVKWCGVDFPLFRADDDDPGASLGCFYTPRPAESEP
jgi:hypothetical protein